MKKSLKIAVLSLATLALASCAMGGGNTPSKEPQKQTETTVVAESTTKAVEYTEVATTEVEAGKYMLNKDVYDIDKTNKKITVTTVENYDQFKNNTGTKKFEETIKYIDYSGKNAVYFKNDGKEYFIYVSGSSTKFEVKTGISISSGGIAKITAVDPELGTYVSAEQEQYKVDASGNRILEGDSYVKEKFYLFVVLEATSAKVYVGDNATTHRDTPILSLDNYKAELINGRVYIRIPHQTEGYKFSLRFDPNGVYHFTNDYEKHGDYSASGTLTKIS